MKEYRAKNIDVMRQYESKRLRDAYAKDPQRFIESARAWQRDNPERLRERRREYYRKNRHKFPECRKAAERKKNENNKTNKSKN